MIIIDPIKMWSYHFLSGWKKINWVGKMRKEGEREEGRERGMKEYRNKKKKKRRAIWGFQ